MVWVSPSFSLWVQFIREIRVNYPLFRRRRKKIFFGGGFYTKDLFFSIIGKKANGLIAPPPYFFEQLPIEGGGQLTRIPLITSLEGKFDKIMFIYLKTCFLWRFPLKKHCFFRSGPGNQRLSDVDNL